MQELPRIQERKNLVGTRVLLRTGLNVPVAGGGVVNDFRIRKALPTIEYLREAGARVIICAHIGRDDGESLEPVYRKLKQYVPAAFVEDVAGEKARAAAERLADGEVLLLENLRSERGEEDNDADFSKRLAGIADIYVNDAFSASHRTHASIVGVPRLLPHYAGLLFQEEVAALEYAREPQSPSVFVLGGAKFETKAPLIEKFLDVYDTVFVGGALANDLLKAKGYEIGRSMVSNEQPSTRVLEHEHLALPPDVVVETQEGRREVRRADDIRPTDYIYDAGPETAALLEEKVKKAQFVLWNGPLGNYEKGFFGATEALAASIAESDAHSIIGGGDTVAAVAALDVERSFDFVSTGGGAMLEFLEKGTLPGIDALLK